MSFKSPTQLRQSFSHDESGAIAIIFAITLTVVVLIGGLALDYARGLSTHTDMQAAADTAVLAAVRAKSADDSLNTKQLEKIARDFFDRNYSDSVNIDHFKLIDDGNGSYRVDVGTEMQTTLMNVSGLADMSLNVTSSAMTSQSGPLELALVLDNTGSMSGSKLASLKRAAKDLIDTMLPNSGSDETKIALIPFGMYVNVGEANANASWMSVSDPAAWNGCAGSRNYPLNIQDGSYGTDSVPGLLNTSCGEAITPLSSNQNDLKVAINNMAAGGWTYIPSGLAWGWRALSSEAPFTQGKTQAEMTEEGGTKAIVLMTDGENTRSPNYPDHDGWDTTLANTITGELCTNVKAQEVVIYTIAFEVSDLTTKDMIKNCATKTSYYYDASNSGELAEAFSTIAGELKQLRLTH